MPDRAAEGAQRERVGLASLLSGEAVLAVGLVANFAQIDSLINSGWVAVLRVVSLVVCAIAGLMLWLERRNRPRWSGRSAVLAMVVAASLTTSAVTFVPTADPVRGEGTAEPVTEPEPFIRKSGYRLKPSSFINSNDRDKIDLDTGCPGRGATPHQLGPARCGELADLIVEDYGIHTPDSEPRITVLTGPASYNTCHNRTDGVGTVALDAITSDTELCVTTDKDNVAAVHIDTVDNNGDITLSYEVWTP